MLFKKQGLVHKKAVAILFVKYLDNIEGKKNPNKQAKIKQQQKNETAEKKQSLILTKR